MMKYRFPIKQSAAGFTLIEMIAAMVIIGVLFSIAAPGWLAFSNRQRINSVRDELLREIRQAQSEATRLQRRQTLTINPNVDPPTVQSSNTQARALGNGEIKPGMIRIQANNPNSLRINFDAKGYIIDAQGNPLEDADFPLRLTVSPVNVSNVKSCVTVQTLLGAARTASDENCN